jgi:hypothetical protein
MDFNPQRALRLLQGCGTAGRESQKNNRGQSGAIVQFTSPVLSHSEIRHSTNPLSQFDKTGPATTTRRIQAIPAARQITGPTYFKQQLQGNLQLSGSIDLRRDDASCVVTKRGIWRRKLRPVEEVECFSAKLKIDILEQMRVLERSQPRSTFLLEP